MTVDFARIDRRETRYRFDLEKDVPWLQARAPGLHYGPRLLERLGLTHELPDACASAALQVCLGLATCDAFARLEEDVIQFVTEHRQRLPGSRSIELLLEEEHKHAALFRRYASALREQHPQTAALFDRLYEPPVTF